MRSIKRKLDEERVKNLKDNAMLKHRPELFYEWDFEKNDEIGLDVYKVTYGSNKKPWWVCPVCESRYIMKISSKSSRNPPQNCPYCSGVKANHTNSLHTIHLKLSEEWHPTKNGDLTPKDVTQGSHKKVWWLGECGHEWEATVKNRALLKSGCPFCDGKRVLVGFNDMWTTNPDLAKLLANPEDGYKYTDMSNQKVNWKCATCQEEIGNKTVGDINKRGLSCPRCSDGISFPEKFMYNLLLSKGINFNFDEKLPWSHRFRYDFYLPDINWIVEVHGVQHYEEGFLGIRGRRRGLKEEQENDKKKKELAMKNGIDKYIIIDARNSTVQWLKSNILNSDLASMLGEDVDYKEIGRSSLHNSLIKDACNLWEKGNRDISKISKLLKINIATVGKYLKRGVELGWCDYDPKESRKLTSRKNGLKRVKSVVQLSEDNTLIKVWPSIKEAAKSIGVQGSSISMALGNINRMSGGYRWILLENYEKHNKEVFGLYKLTGKNNIFDPLGTVLFNRGILQDELEWFLNPTKREYDNNLLKNIHKGVELLLRHIEQGNHIHLQIDKDWDGMTSAAALMNYLFEVFPTVNLTWTNHTSKKKHGIEVDLIPDTAKLLITPDASSGEYEIHKELHKRGIDILIADHHEASHYSPYAITINNQLDDYPNKELSGAGIVYKLIQCIDRYLGINSSEKYIDLVAFGLIGDGMSTRSKETRWLITKGLNNINNELLKELIKENTEKSEQLTISKVAFKINPKVNSLIRTGTNEELDDFVKALLEHQEITINSRLKTEDKRETWARRVTRTCNNTYARQKKLRDKIMRELESKIESEKLYENNFIIVEAEGEYNTNMSGYVAMFLVNKYRKPVIILRESSEGVLAGSLRGYDPFMKNTKDFLNSLDLFDWCEGHQNACGVQITRENRSLLDKTINEACVAQNFTSASGEIDVDFIAVPKAINLSLAKQLDSYAHIWGKGIEEPLFAVEQLRISSRTVMRKPSGYTKWTSNGVDYVIFTGDSELNTYLDKYPNSDLILNVIGSLGMNTFLGRETPQFAIKELEVEEVKNNSFGF